MGAVQIGTSNAVAMGAAASAIGATNAAIGTASGADGGSRAAQLNRVPSEGGRGDGWVVSSSDSGADTSSISILLKEQETRVYNFTACFFAWARRPGKRLRTVRTNVNSTTPLAVTAAFRAGHR